MALPRRSFRWPILVLSLGLLTGMALWWSGQTATGQDMPERLAMANVRVTAPEFPEGLSWLNTERPLSLRELRGKVLLLDFWTYCCINCQHVMPDLKRLEAKYPNELVVIGVHSAKFTTEQGTDNIRQAILRHGLHHPVINDKDFQVWQRYAVHAWPTLVLIDPDGEIVLDESGEGLFDQFDQAIGATIAEFDQAGRLNRKPLVLRSEATTAVQRPLAFPGKVIADSAGKRLIISDTNHHRIIVLSLPDHHVDMVIGRGREGDADGDVAQAAFRQPQGLALQGDTLYVADTENHRIRAVDLRQKRVTTIAGTGVQAFRLAGGKATETPLNSPWDLTAVGDTLYIAMAGNHQIWALNLTDGLIRPYAGSGREDREDGTLSEAAFAQPSGITTDGKHLFVADAETSSIRQVDLPPGKAVSTLVGLALFEFGDKDGQGHDVRLQHPLGLTWHDGRLYVADTYNNKVKVIDPDTRTSTTYAGTGTAGHADGAAASFDEPGGLAIAGNRLYVADTNNHLLRAVELADRSTRSVAIPNLDRLAIAPAMQPQTSRQVPGQQTAPGQQRLELSLRLPAGYHLNPDAPSVVTVTGSGSVHTAGDTPATFSKPGSTLAVPLTVAAGGGTVTVDLSLYYCETGQEALCRVHNDRFTVPVTVMAGQPAVRPLHLDVTVPSP